MDGWVLGGWVAGLIEIITNSAKLKLELELSLAIFKTAMDVRIDIHF